MGVWTPKICDYWIIVMICIALPWPLDTSRIPQSYPVSSDWQRPKVSLFQSLFKRCSPALSRPYPANLLFSSLLFTPNQAIYSTTQLFFNLFKMCRFRLRVLLHANDITDLDFSNIYLVGSLLSTTAATLIIRSVILILHEPFLLTL